MKTIKLVFLSFLICVSPWFARAQGTFQNLGFEAATLIPIPGDLYGSVEFGSAFPGWTCTVGGQPWNSVLFNNTFLDSSGISIIDSNGQVFASGTNVRVIAGRYSAVLQAGWLLGSPGWPADVTLSQSSLVPVSAESLRFRAYTKLVSPFVVSLGGQQLPLVILDTSPGYTVYGANIHAWQGQHAGLDFTISAQRPHIDNSYVLLDAIQFSTQPIPEPAVGTFLGVTALVFTRRLFQRQGSKILKYSSSRWRGSWQKPSSHAECRFWS